MPETPLPYNEKELLALIAEGNVLAYQQVFNRYWNNIYQAALGFLKSSSLAEDAVQVVFLRFWEKRSLLREVDKLEAYLFIMARNHIMNVLRQQSRLPEASPPADLIPADYLLPDRQMEYKEMTELVQEYLGRLPPQQQLIFRMSREQGLSHPEIALALGISQATVKSHIIRALNTLRQYLQGHL